MQSRKKKIRIGVSAAVFSLALFAPINAYALPNPFFIIVITDIIIQLLLLLALSIPLALLAVRRKYYRLLPRKALRFLAALLLLSIISSGLFSFDLSKQTQYRLEADPLHERLENCRPLSPELANELQLPEGAFLLDPRHPLAFQSYHLKGACNFSLEELMTLPSVRNKLRSEGKSLILTLEDFELSPPALFQGSPQAMLSSNDPDLPDMSGVNWGTVKGGTLHYYKGNTNKGAGIGPAPATVINDYGQAVGKEFGPVWSMGNYISVMGYDSDWRQQRPAVIRQTLEAGEWVIDLRHTRQENARGDIIRMRHYMADLDLLDRLAGSEVRQVLFVCNSNRSCLAGEILAREIKERGGNILGYVQFNPDSPIAADPAFGYPEYINPHSSSILAWLILIAILLLSPLIAGTARSIMLLADSHLKSIRIFYKARVFATLAPLLLIFSILPVSSEFTTANMGESWLNLLLFDMNRCGLPWLGGTYALIFIGLILIIENEIGHSNKILRGLLLMFFIIPWFLPGPTVFPLTLSIYEIVLIIAVIYSQPLSAWLLRLIRSSKIRRGLQKPMLVGLSEAACASYCGAKTAWLAEAQKDGLTVPVSAVLLTQAGTIDNDQMHRILRKTRLMLGAGPYVVRSSAPAEDAAGDITPGKYHSEYNIELDSLATAINAVLDDYINKGVLHDTPVAVLIQRQVAGRIAGVAMREPDTRGAGILVEYGDRYNFSITSGSERGQTARIGSIYRNWLNDKNRKQLPGAVLFNDVFDRLENRFGQRLEIEWTYNRGILTLLQVRCAPHEDSAPHQAAADLLKILQARLKSLAARPRAIVLDKGDLSELPSRVSRATFELLSDIWRNDDARSEAFGALMGRLHPQAVKPAVIRIAGQIYFNRIPENPRLTMLKMPALRVLKLLLPLFIGRRIAHLSDELKRLEESVKIPFQSRENLSPAEAAHRLLESRNELLCGSGKISAAVALLLSSILKRKDLHRLEERDPFLIELAAGKSIETLAANFPMRALHDLLLEEPRLLEIHAVRARRLGLTAIEMQGDRLSQLAALRGRSRQILAAQVTCLRQDYLALGRVLQIENIFEIPLTDVEALATGTIESYTVTDAESLLNEDISLPPGLNLKQLEALAADGRFEGDTDKTTKKAVLIGQPAIREAVLVIPHRDGLSTLFSKQTGEIPAALLLNAPDIETIATMPADWLLICSSGSALCHAALLARKRSIKAVFSAALPAEKVSDGDRISIDFKGRIEILRP